MSNRLTHRLWKVIPNVGSPPPEGWLTIAEFAERAGGILVQQIYKAIDNGKIPRKHLAMMLGGSQRTIVIDWDATAYDFIAGRRQGSRPADFIENAAREYKPFRLSAQQEIAAEAEDERRHEIENEVIDGNTSGLSSEQIQNIVDERLVNEKMVKQPVVDTTSARYRKEQLEIEKRQVELRKEANQLIDLDTMRGILGGLAAEIKGAANRAIPAYGPILAAEENPTVVRGILKKIFADLLRPLLNNKDNEGCEDEEKTSG